jgi:hypothetical protein
VVAGRWQALGLTLSRILIRPQLGLGGAGLSGAFARAVVASLAAVATSACAVAVVGKLRPTVSRRALAWIAVVALASLALTWFVPALAVLLVVLVALGTWQLVHAWRDPSRSRAAVCFAVAYVLTFVAGVWWLPFDWPRYYAPTLGLTSVLVAMGAADLEDAAARAIRG